MHLTLVISSLNSGGAERVLSELANHWIETHKVSIVTLSPSNSKPFYPLHKDVNVIHLNQTNTRPTSLFTRLANIVKRVFLLRSTLKTLSPDLVISFVDIMNITTLLASLGLKIPIIISERIDPSHHPLPWIYKWLRLKTYPLSQKLIVQTLSAASYFPDHFKHFLTVIPNPVKSQLKTAPFREHAKFLISIGRLTSQKDHKTLILAFSNLIKIHKDLTLTIYGEGEERRNLEMLIEDLKLANKVFLRGTTKNISSVLMKSDLFIFPSRYEGFPNALCEAMAMGLPVIASNCSGNKDIIREGIDGRLFPVGNVEVLTQVILEVLQDTAQRKKLSHNAKTVIQRFNASHIFSLWDNILSTISRKQKENEK